MSPRRTRAHDSTSLARLGGLAAGLVLGFAGCTSTAPGAPADAATATEAGVVPVPVVDGGPDTSSDASAPDSAPPADSGDSAPPADSGACPPSYAGCGTFVSLGPGDQTITFRNYAYEPKCLSVKVGTKLTFVAGTDGDFLIHPLVQACGPAPVLDFRDAGTTASFVPTVPGVYGYYCLDHGNPVGAAMSGAVQVVP